MQKKSATELCQILRMVTMVMVINSTHVIGIRMTISCLYCIAFEVMLLVSIFFFFVTLRGRHAVCSRGHILGRFCIAAYWSILMPFQHGLPFRMD